MNKRQAKKRRKKALYEKLTNIAEKSGQAEECYEKLVNMAEKIGQVLNKWLESGMPIPKEGEKNGI